MEESYIQNLFSERIGGKLFGKSDTLYKFAKIKLAKAEAQAENPGVALIDMGVGEPDDMAYSEVVKTLQEAATKPENRGYADNGGVSFREAVVRYMDRVFGVALDVENEIMHSIGSKVALSMLPACFINPGDYALMTTPGYGIFGIHTEFYGGKIYNLPLKEENAFLPDLESVSEAVLKKAKVLVLNYPNNPTGASATLDFYEKAVAWAKAHGILILQDAAYSALVFDGAKPISIFKISGAKDVAVELHSLSKGFNMTGWRMGWVCGNPLVVQAYGDVKNKTDSGQFLAVQIAAAKALDSLYILEENAKKYSRRMDLLIDALNAVGFQIKKPQGGFFLYCKAPKSVDYDGKTETFDSGEAFSQWLIYKQLISTVPWDETGAYVRFSATFTAPSEKEEIAIVEELKKRLGVYTFRF